MRHVFVSVVRSNQDAFAGLRRGLAADGTNEFVHVSFDESEFAYIDKVEYTWRRFFRTIYYPPIFRSLVRRLDAALSNLDGDEAASVYFTDEGVWAVIWSEYRRRAQARGKVYGVNVQHGHAEIRPVRYIRLRRAINALSRLATGFPCLGYGSLGGAGPEAFDLYLTYEAVAAQHLQERLGCMATAAPRVIKHDLIAGYAALPRPTKDGQTRVLFAMNINMRGSPIKCDVPQTLDQLLDLAMALHEQDARLVFRLHPGMERGKEAARFAAHPISRFAELDTIVSLQESISRVQIVMSFLSTVLWEAGLVGLVPVQVICRCCDDARLTFEREVLHLNADMPSRLAELLARACQQPPMSWQEREAAEWSHVRLLLQRLSH